MNNGGISVVIATRGDSPDSLARCLDAVAAGCTPPAETIVVTQGSAPAATGVVVVRQGGSGLARARNEGIRRASGAAVAITDDDCVPTPEWLDAAAAALAADPDVAAVSGPVLPLPDPTGTLVPVSSRTQTVASTTGRTVAPWAVGSGGNMVVRREWLERLGGYDERLGAGSPGRAGEDVDLIHRLLRAGGRIRYEPRAAVLHEQKDPQEHRARRGAYGFGVGAACGSWARSGDATAIPVLLAWVALRGRLLAGALLRRRLHVVADEVRVLGGTVGGIAYGVRRR